MSRRDGRDPRALPEDLDALGRALERAAGHQLARRRLVMRIVQSMAIVAIAVPCVLAIWATELGPGTGSAPVADTPVPSPTSPPPPTNPQTNDIAVAEDGTLRASRPGPCQDDLACAAARSKSVFVTEDRR